MNRIKNIKNQEFGKLKVKKLAFTNRNHSHWLCKCECGNEKVIRIDALTSGGTRSCGCISRQQNKNHYLWKGYGEISSDIWNKIRRGANRKRLSILFDITIKQAWEVFQKQKGKCALSGVKIHFPEKAYNNGGVCTASLDRIDSSCTKEW